MMKGIGIGLLVMGLLAAIVGVVMHFVIHQKVDQGIVDKLVIDGPNDEDYESFVNEPDEGDVPLYYKFHLYHVENEADIVASGAKPKIKQVGPYVYQVKGYKIDTTYDGDEVSYKLHETYIFQRDLSVGDESDTVTLLNPKYFPLAVGGEIAAQTLLSALTFAKYNPFQDDPVLAAQAKILFEHTDLANWVGVALNPASKPEDFAPFAGTIFTNATAMPEQTQAIVGWIADAAAPLPQAAMLKASTPNPASLISVLPLLYKDVPGKAKFSDFAGGFVNRTGVMKLGTVLGQCAAAQGGDTDAATAVMTEYSLASQADLLAFCGFLGNEIPATVQDVMGLGKPFRTISVADWIFGSTDEQLTLLAGVDPPLYNKNATHAGTYVENTGSSDIKKIGQYVQYDGAREACAVNPITQSCDPIWNEDIPIQGTDGTVFEPSLDGSELLEVWVDSFQRTAHFLGKADDGKVRDVDVDGIPTIRYEIPSDFLNCETDEQKLRCEVFKQTVSGVANLAPAYSGLPIGATKPRLMDVPNGEAYRAKFDGYETFDREIHETYLLVQPTFGRTIIGYQRIQANIVIPPLNPQAPTFGTNLFTKHSKIPQDDVVWPAFWLEKAADIRSKTDKVADLHEALDDISGFRKMADLLLWILCPVGGAMFLAGVAMLVMAGKDKSEQSIPLTSRT